MVRLRSDRWYSQEGQFQLRKRAAPQVASSRRLLSMVVLLALTWIMFQRAGDPQIYVRAFKALGVPLTGVSNADRASVDRGGSADLGSDATQRSGSAFDSSPQLDLQSLLPHASTIESETADRLKAAMLESWAVLTPNEVAAIARHRWGKGTANKPDVGNAESRIVEAIAKFTEEFQLVWQRLSKEIQDSPSANSQPVDWPTLWREKLASLWRDNHTIESEKDLELRTVVQLQSLSAIAEMTLDLQLSKQCRDAAPWRSAETDFFQRALQRVESGAVSGRSDSAALIGFTTLADRMSEYRGNWLKFRGWIQTAKKIEPKSNVYGIKPYWTIWLKPSDNSPHPVVAYLTEVPEGVQECEAQDGTERFGEIEITGIAMKKLAYNATSGIEVAPAIAGYARQFITPPNSTEGRDGEVGGQQNADVTASPYQMIGNGVFVLAASLIVVAWVWMRGGPTKKLKFRADRSMIFLGLCASLYGIPLSAIAQDTPATTSDPILEQLAARLDQAAMDEIQSFAAAPEAIGLPDALLKIQFTMHQLTEQRLRSAAQASLTASGWHLEEIDATVVEAKVIRLTEKQKLWMQQSSVFELSIVHGKTGDNEVPEGERSVIKLYAKRIPLFWLTEKTLLQPIQSLVLSVDQPKVEGEDVASKFVTPILIADHVHWRVTGSIDVETIEPKLPSDWLQAAQHGWDLSWNDLVSERQSKPLEEIDRESFYTLIAASAKMATDNEMKQPQKRTPPGPLLATPKDQVVRHVVLPVRAVRATRIAVSDLREKSWLGQDHYFEIDGFVQYPNGRITVNPPPPADGEEGPTKAEPIVYEGEFPITLVALSLPNYLQAGAGYQGGDRWQIDEPWIEVAGTFYRTWSYRSEMLDRIDSRQRQMAPLVAVTAITPSTIPIASTGNLPVAWLSWLICIAIFFLMALIWVYAMPEKRRKVK